MADESDAWGVGVGGAILRTADGGVTWQQQSTGAVRTFEAVDGLSSDLIVAVGHGGSIQVWDGGSWTGQYSGTNVDLNAVAVVAEDDIWAAGDEGVVVHWDGHVWSRVAVPVSETIGALWASGADDVWAAGSGSDSIMRWNGSSWILMGAEFSGTRALWGDSAGDVWAGGGGIHRWSGASWEEIGGNGYQVGSIWGSASDDVWFTGVGGRSMAHYDGVTITNIVLPEPAAGFYRGVHGSSPSDILVVEGDSLIREWDGTSWPVINQGVLDQNGYIAWGQSPSNLRAFSSGDLYRWDGASWELEFDGFPETPVAMWGSDEQNIWVVGDDGMIWKWDGSNWAAQVSGTTRDLDSVSGTSSSDVWAVGGGAIYHWDGIAWSEALADEVGIAPTAIHAIAPDLVFGCGGGGMVVRWDGVAWQRLADLTSERLYGIWGADTANVWVVGSRGVMLRKSAAGWEIEPSGTLADLRSVAGNQTDGGVVAVGARGAVIRRVEGVWKPEASGTQFWKGPVVSLPGGRFVSHNRISPPAGSELREPEVSLEMPGIGELVPGQRIVDLGPVPTGIRTQWELLVRNLGSSALTIFGDETSGMGAAEIGFTRTDSIVEPSAGEIIVVSFDPETPGTREVQFSLFTDDPDQPRTDIKLRATAFTPLPEERWQPSGSAGDSNELIASWFSGDSIGWAVGRKGRILMTVDGGVGWAIQDSGVESDLWDVWGIDEANVWAVGSDGVILRWNGAVWTPQLSGTDFALRGIDGVAGDKVWAVGIGGGGAGIILYWDGASWSEQPADDLTGLSDVWAASADEAWAVGGRRIFRWDGSQWQRDDFDPVVGLNAVWGSGSAEVWTVGSDGKVFRWDGSQWSEVDSDVGWNLRGVWGTGLGEAWAVAGDGVVKWDGSKWRIDFVVRDGAGLRDVAGGPASLYAVGMRGRVMKREAGTWTTVRSTVATNLNAVWNHSSNLAIAVGRSGEILRWDGTSWNVESSGTTMGLNGVWGSDAQHVWAVGDSGTILFWDGAGWTQQLSGTGEQLSAIWGSASDRVLAVGNRGVLLEWDGSVWGQVDLGVSDRFSSVWGSGPDDIWIDADHHFDGTSWSTRAIGFDISALSMWGTTSDDIWAVSGVGRLYHYDGSQWGTNQELPDRGVASVWASDADNAWACGSGGALYRWDGIAWRLQPSPARSLLRSLSGNASGQVFAVGGLDILTTVPALSPRETWRMAHFGSSENVGDAAGFADPDSDGVSNIEEFAFGLDPRVGYTPVVGMGGGSRLLGGLPKTEFGPMDLPDAGRFVFLRRKNYLAEGLDYLPESSRDLIGWSQDLEMSIVGGGEEFEIVAVPVGFEGAREYLRLVIGTVIIP